MPHTRVSKEGFEGWREGESEIAKCHLRVSTRERQADKQAQREKRQETKKKRSKRGSREQVVPGRHFQGVYMVHG